MVNNFQAIRNLISFPDKTSFYFLQLLKRRKDNPDLDKDVIHIADYYIYSFEQFDKMEKTIVDHCNIENARAYFRINRRDAKKLGMKVLKRVVEYMESENYLAIKNVYASCAGEFHSDEDKKWIVDVDYKDIPGDYDLDDFMNRLTSKIQELVYETGRDDSVYYMPTKNGIHIICRPFNLKKFGDYYSMDVHKDNMVILYCP